MPEPLDQPLGVVELAERGDGLAQVATSSKLGPEALFLQGATSTRPPVGRVVLQALIELEATESIGAAPYEAQ